LPCSRQYLTFVHAVPQVDMLGPEAVFVVSKAGDEIALKTIRWLHHHDVFARTGLREDHIHFCTRHRDKAPICQR